MNPVYELMITPNYQWLDYTFTTGCPDIHGGVNVQSIKPAMLKHFQ